MRVMTGGDAERRTGRRAASSPGRVTGAQTGAVLAFVSSGILGQYDPFAQGERPGIGGELLLVYPNVIAVERQLRVSPADFRLWVCLHEVTHRVQFRANPWLADHMSACAGRLTDDEGQELTQVVGRLGEFVRSKRRERRQATEPNSEGIVGVPARRSSPSRSARRSTSCWCSARCSRATPIT